MASFSSSDPGQRSSSPRPVAKRLSDASKSSDFAFLIHSQNSLNVSLSSDADAQNALRQRRRRTSPEDQAILEAEYENNSKPDKAARAEIVKLVALGEKEVQIWFQNRRQMTRRKTQPFSFPNTDSALFSSQESQGTSAYSSFSASDQSQPDPVSSQTSYVRTQPPTTQVEESLPREEQKEKPQPPSAVIKSSEPISQIGEAVSGTDRSRVEGILPRSVPTVPAKQRPRNLARSRTSPFDIHQDQSSESPSSTAKADASVGDKTTTQGSASTLRRTTSLIRLSTSLEGKAKVAIGDSPSPPRFREPRPGGGLQRSQSAIGPSNNPALASMQPTVRSQKPSMPGRSRDARTWEFYCDSSARDALTEQAQREQSGSAVGAIGLIRSRSNKALASNPNKRNARPEKHESSKRLKADGKQSQKQKLSRTQSSVARLQTVNGTSQTQAGNVRQKLGKPGSQLEVDHDGDSDKENWEPGTQHRRPENTHVSSSRARRSVLEESLKVPSQSSSLDTLMRRENSSPRKTKQKPATVDNPDQHNDEPIDEEVDQFRNGSQLPREPDDLDCVQNLLSLSQGNWQ